MSHSRKAIIGASAGVCLALIRLMEAGFYLGKPTHDQIGAYLTCVALIAIGAIYASFVNEQEPAKVFMQGLLAPSLLIAIVNGGPANNSNAPSGRGAAPITNLDAPQAKRGFNPFEILFPSAHAAERPAMSTSARTNAISPHRGEFSISTNSLPPLDQISRDQFQGSLLGGAKRVFGRGEPVKNYIYVIGRTTNQSVAFRTAQKISALPEFTNEVRIVQPDGKQEYFLTVGQFGDLGRAAAIKEASREAAFRALRMDESRGVRDSADLLTSGRIVDGRALFKE